MRPPSTVSGRNPTCRWRTCRKAGCRAWPPRRFAPRCTWCPLPEAAEPADTNYRRCLPAFRDFRGNRSIPRNIFWLRRSGSRLSVEPDWGLPARGAAPTRARRKAAARAPTWTEGDPRALPRNRAGGTRERRARESPARTARRAGSSSLLLLELEFAGGFVLVEKRAQLRAGFQQPHPLLVVQRHGETAQPVHA